MLDRRLFYYTYSYNNVWLALSWWTNRFILTLFSYIDWITLVYDSKSLEVQLWFKRKGEAERIASTAELHTGALSFTVVVKLRRVAVAPTSRNCFTIIIEDLEAKSDSFGIIILQETFLVFLYMMNINYFKVHQSDEQIG